MIKEPHPTSAWTACGGYRWECEPSRVSFRVGLRGIHVQVVSAQKTKRLLAVVIQIWCRIVTGGESARTIHGRFVAVVFVFVFTKTVQISTTDTPWCKKNIKIDIQPLASNFLRAHSISLSGYQPTGEIAYLKIRSQTKQALKVFELLRNGRFRHLLHEYGFQLSNLIFKSISKMDI